MTDTRGGAVDLWSCFIVSCRFLDAIASQELTTDGFVWTNKVKIMRINKENGILN